MVQQRTRVVDGGGRMLIWLIYGAGSDAPPSKPPSFLQVVYMFIQIWADRAVSELLDARTGPEAWARPTLPLPLRPHTPHQQQQQQASASSRAPPTTSSSSASAATASSSSSPAVLVSPLEALLRRCFHLINPEGAAAAEPSMEFKEVRG